MTELLHWAFSPINMVFSVLLISIILYWITIILGILDTDLFNIDLPNPDLDLDMEADVDLDAEMDVDLSTGVIWGVARWFYVGEVPIMVLISIFILSLWTGAILGNYYFNPEQTLFRALIIFNINWILSLFIVKVVAAPIRPLYAAMNRDFNAAPQIMGSQCRVITTQVTSDSLGQAEVTTKGAPLVLNVKAEENHVFQKDDEAIIIAKDKESGVFTIAPNKQ